MEVLTDVEGNVGILLNREEALMLAAMHGPTNSGQRYELIQEAMPYFEEEGIIFPDDKVIRHISDHTMYELFSLLYDALTKK